MITGPAAPRLFGLTTQAVVILCAILFCSLALPLGAHGTQPARIIVDTDMALDDVRALILFTAGDRFDLKCVITSDGACAPQAGANNAARLLADLARPEIPVGAGLALSKPGPPWRPMSESLGWADISTEGRREPAGDGLALLADVLEHGEGQFVYVCLGPLSNLAALMKTHPQLVADRISTVYYQGSCPDTTVLSWNTARDSGAAACVFAATVPLRAFALEDSAYTVFDTTFLERFAQCSSSSCGLLRRLHANPRVRGLVEAGHFRCWDETIPLYLADQELCTFVPVAGRDHVAMAASWQRDAAGTLYVTLLSEDHQ